MDKSKLIRYGLFAVIGTIVVILFFRSCSLYDQNSILKGRYDELKKVSAADHAKLMKEIGALTADIVQRDKEINKLTESITLIYTDLTNKDSRIAELIRKLAEAEAAGDFPAQIVNLREQVRIWSEKFSLAESIIAEKDKIIGEWAVKYADAVKIGEDWKKQYEQENALGLLCEKRVGKLESSLRWTKFWRIGTTTLAIVAGGYAGYTLLKGGSK